MLKHEHFFFKLFIYQVFVTCKHLHEIWVNSYTHFTTPHNGYPIKSIHKYGLDIPSRRSLEQGIVGLQLGKGLSLEIRKRLYLPI